MRTYLYLAAVAASAAVVALPVTSANAAGHVLTITKTGGTAVQVGAVLKSGLAKSTTAVFALMGEQLTCKSSTFSATVKTNPTTPGTATESLTSQTFASCTVNVTGVTVKSVKAQNLPFKVSVSDATGDPVKVSGQSKTKPIRITFTVVFMGSPVTCGYKAASISGHASNVANTVAFSMQKFTKVSGGSLCLASANFSATYGPVVDSSVTGSPKVFVN